MENGFLCEVDSTGIVAPDGGTGLGSIQLSEEEAEPPRLLGRHGDGVELCFAGGESDRGGAGGAPGNEAAPEGETIPLADKARQDTDRVGEVGASAHHGVHQGPDQLSVRTGGGTVGGCRRELVADLEGCGDGFGRGHLEAFKDLLEAVDRAAKFPNGVGREREVPALGTLHEDALMEFTLEKCRGDIHRVQDHAAPADEVQEHADDRGSGGRRVGVKEVMAVPLRESFGAVAGLIDRVVAREELDPKYPFALDHVVVERAGYVDEGAVADKGLILFEDCLAPMRVVGACHSFVIISRLEDDGRAGEDKYRGAGHAEGDCLGVGEEVEAKKFTMGGVSVVNTMGGEIGREMVIEEFTAAIGMEAANGTTEVGARLLGPGDDEGR
ncbi:hypothetical protein CLOM_g13827, partial [Closterium sp. NIES-68]